MLTRHVENLLLAFQYRYRQMSEDLRQRQLDHAAAAFGANPLSGEDISIPTGEFLMAL